MQEKLRLMKNLDNECDVKYTSKLHILATCDI
jgi:hypothetical protein